MDDDVMRALPVSEAPTDMNPVNGIALEPQRIRTYVIKYEPQPQQAGIKAEPNECSGAYKSDTPKMAEKQPKVQTEKVAAV